MRFVHSLNTKPIFLSQLYGVPIFYRLVGTIICSAMSLTFVKVRGHQIVLHTDDVGKDLLSFLPYDEIHTTVNDIPDTFHPKFWASCKMFAMEKEPLNSIHIDNDVFIKRVKAFDIIQNSDYDLLIQETETANTYNLWTDLFFNHPEYMNQMGIDVKQPGAYNTGIMNFRNQELKDKFIQGYKNIVEYYSKNYKDFLDEGKTLIPDLMAEQKHLYQISKGYKVHGLLEPMRENEGFSHDIGYQHLLTVFKYTKLNKVMEMLEKVEPDLYRYIDNFCSNLYEKGEYNGIDLEIPEDNKEENNDKNESN